MLTPRETEILAHSSQGLPAKCIAPLLGISERTVEFHRENAVRKLGSANIIKACCDAIRLGLIPAVAAVGVAVIALSGEQARLDIESYQELNRATNTRRDSAQDTNPDCYDEKLFWFQEDTIIDCETDDEKRQIRLLPWRRR